MSDEDAEKGLRCCIPSCTRKIHDRCDVENCCNLKDYCVVHITMHRIQNDDDDMGVDDDDQERDEDFEDVDDDLIFTKLKHLDIKQ